MPSVKLLSFTLLHGDFKALPLHAVWYFLGSFHPFPVPQSRDHHWFLVLHTHLPFPVIIKCYMHFNLPINFQVANFGPRALCLVCS